MFSLLKNHPFAVEAFFESSFVVTFAIRKEQIEHLIPECLELDVFDNKWAFVAVAMVQTRGLRPKGFPGFFGNDFFLIGYRIFVRYQSTSGKRLRGLYILKSETDKNKSDWKEARRFAGPLPFTFTYSANKKEVLIIEGVRQNWTPKPVRVVDYNFSFLHSPEFEGALLANAFVIRGVPYYWEKGKIEQWKK